MSQRFYAAVNTAILHCVCVPLCVCVTVESSTCGCRCVGDDYQTVWVYSALIGRQLNEHIRLTWMWGPHKKISKGLIHAEEQWWRVCSGRAEQQVGLFHKLWMEKSTKIDGLGKWKDEEKMFLKWNWSTKLMMLCFFCGQYWVTFQPCILTGTVFYLFLYL